ncbi:MAG TPA: pitrilysin family protein, partial [Fervidobacterium nodosum]|nr:pitrilysin family protein [Fervidobacterium nodosum]
SEEIPYVRSVSIGVWISVGSRDENEKNNGVTHLIEHMVFKGTKKRTARMIAQSLESVGGYLNAFTSKEHTCYYARVLDEHIEKAVDVLSDLILHPEFDKDELEKEKAIILEEIKNYEDEPDEIIHDEFEKLLFNPHPLGYNILGTRESLENLNKKEIENYKKIHYSSDNIIICAAGNIPHQKLVDLSYKYFGELKKTKNGYKRVSPKVKKKAEVLKIEKPIQQAHLCYGSYAFNVSDERRFPLLILNTLLGDGMSSRLYQSVREKKGLAYSVYSFANLLTDIGSFGVYAGIDKCKLDVSLLLIEKELERIKKVPITESELKRTKAQVKGNMVLGLESMSNRMMRLAKSEIYYRKYQSVDSLIEKINKVSIEAVQK